MTESTSRHGLAGDASQWLLVQAVQREWADRNSKGIGWVERATPFNQLYLMNDNNVFTSRSCTLEAEIAALEACMYFERV